MIKDIVGNELNVGDTVAFNPQTYKGIILGTVVGFTPEIVQVKYQQPYWKNTPEGCTVPEHPHFLVKIVK